MGNDESESALHRVTSYCQLGFSQIIIYSKLCISCHVMQRKALRVSVCTSVCQYGNAMQCKAIQCNIRRPLPLPLQGEAPETAKHQQRPVLLHWQAVQELTAPRPAALRRRGLSRSAMLFRCGKTCVFEPFCWPLKLVL